MNTEAEELHRRGEELRDQREALEVRYREIVARTIALRELWPSEGAKAELSDLNQERRQVAQSIERLNRRIEELSERFMTVLGLHPPDAPPDPPTSRS